MAEPSPILSPNSRTFTKDVAQFFDRAAFGCAVSATDEAANVRSFAVQVKDRLKRNAPNRFVVLVWLTATTGGNPSSTGNTVAFTAGTVLETITANAMWRILTDASGLIAFNLTIAGAATRYVESFVMGRVEESDAFLWT